MLGSGFNSRVPLFGGMQPLQGPRRARSTGSGEGVSGFDLGVCLLFLLLGLLVYNANQRLITASDNYPARFLPFAILGFHSMELDPIEKVVAQGRSQPYWLVRGSDGGMVSQYPVVTPLLISPLYLPAMACLHVYGWTDSRLDRLARLMEKVSASLVASLSVALMYLLLRRRAEAGLAVLLTIAYGFGTNTWVIGSQGLWQHGMAELLLIITLLLVTGECTAMRAFMAGVVCALVAFNRPPDAILVAPLGLYGLWWAGRKWPLLMLGGIIASAPLLAYNVGMVGHLLGGYAIVENTNFFRFSLPAGVAGLLFSPARGLFVFTPFLLALPLALWRAPGDWEARPLALLFCLAFVAQVALYAKVDWRGGCSWGPRYLTDVLPLLVWMLPPVVASFGGIARAAFGLAVCASVAVQVVGAFWYTGKSDEALGVTSPDPARMGAVWNRQFTPFILELRHARAPRDLLMKITGQIDGVKAAGAPVAEAPAGTEITVQGWALANHRKPARIVATMVPQKGTRPSLSPALGDAMVFHPRPDVGAAMHTNAPCGWGIVLHTAGLAPGVYVIDTLAQGDEGGEFHPLGQMAFKVLPAGK